MRLMSKLFAGALAMSFVMASAVTVFASPSVMAVPDADAGAQYEISNITKYDYEDSTDYNRFASTGMQYINEGQDKSPSEFIAIIEKDTNEKTKKSVETVKEAVTGSKFLTNFFDVHVEDYYYANTQYLNDHKDEIPVKRSADGKFVVTLRVPALTEKNKNPFVLHFSKDRQEWETLYPTAIDYTNKTLTIEFKDFSPAAILAVVDAEQAPADAPATVEVIKDGQKVVTAKDSDSSGSSKSSSSKSSSSKSSSSSAKSPKTGVADTWVLWFAASAVLAGVAKKRH